MSYIKTINSFLSKEECELIIQKNINVELNLGEVGSPVGYVIDLEKRNAKVKSIELLEITDRLIKYLDNSEVIKGCSLEQFQEKFQFVKYEEGGHYDWHIDSNPNAESHRICSVVIQLNNEYTGGQLLYMDVNDNIIEFENGIGNLFIFPSDTKHKVTPIITGTRYSLVSWLNLKSKNVKTII